MHKPVVTASLAILLFASAAPPVLSSGVVANPVASSEKLNAELIKATQQEDVQRVKELLAQGADVDAKSRYGATPLFFAADKGNLELVKLLLTKEPELDLVDTFYQATPLTFALSKVSSSDSHRQVVLELLARGSAGAGQALGFAASTGDLELAKAALSVDGIDLADLKAARSAANNSDNKELTNLIEAKIPEEPAREAIRLSADQLSPHVGTFKNEDLGLTITTFLAEDDLKLQVTGQPAVTLAAETETDFRVVEVGGIGVRFTGRGGVTEGFVLDQNGQHYFARAEPDDSGTNKFASTAADKPSPLKEAKRTASRPWPSFRGSGASGNGDGQGAPTTWDGNQGTNVKWKRPIPGIGLSSPIVWGDRVFVTTAISSAGDTTFRTGLYGDVDAVADESEHTWKVYALDAETGKVVWERVASVGVPKVKRHTKSSHANPTPVTDGKHVVAHLGSEGIFTYDMNGTLLWKKEVGKLVSGWFYDASYEWGFSSSPILHNGLVIVQTDIQEGSYIAAFDVTTGEEVWRTERDEIPTWGTPTILPSPKGDEVITNGTTIRGYDAATGKELWTLGPNSEVTVGTPVVSNGIAYVTGGYPPVRPIYAIRPGGRGDISLSDGASESEHIAWSTNRGGTYIPSPTVYDGLLYMTHNDGRLSVHEASTGERVYRARVGKAESFSGSPVVADGKLYFTTEEGKTIVVRAGRVFEKLAENELGEIVMTTPAISDGTLYLRGMNHVFALSDQ